MSQTEALSIIQARMQLLTMAATAYGEAIGWNLFHQTLLDNGTAQHMAIRKQIVEQVERFENVVRQAFPCEDWMLNKAMEVIDDVSSKKCDSLVRGHK